MNTKMDTIFKIKKNKWILCGIKKSDTISAKYKSKPNLVKSDLYDSRCEVGTYIKI